MPPCPLTLGDDEVHIWRASLDCSPSQLSQLARTLSGDERARAERFHFERDRNRFIAGRGTLRAILGRYLGIGPAAIGFCYSDAGKPALLPALNGNLSFNVTHADSLALYAVSRSEVGIDVEHLRDINEADQIANGFFTARENAELRRVPRARRMEAFLRVWTRKEARSKACGGGIAATLDRFEVSLDDDAAGFQDAAGNGLNSSEWMFRDLTPAPRYVAALASRGPKRNLSCFHVCPSQTAPVPES